MRFLVAGDFRSIPLTRGCADALESLGHKVIRVDSEDRIHPAIGILLKYSKSLAKLAGLKQRLSNFYVSKIYQIRRKRLIDAIEHAGLDAALVIRGNQYDLDTLKYLRTKAKTVCWFIRDQKRDAMLRDESGEFDLYYSMHSSHADRGFHYLPTFAYDADNYFPDDRIAKDIPLLFVGIWTPKRQLWLESIQEYSRQLIIIGPHWDSKLGLGHPLRNSVKGKWVGVSELRGLYQRAQVVVNINQWDASELKGVNLRAADVPACGTALLSEYSDDLYSHFDLGKEIAIFKTPAELKQQCAVLLNDNVRRNQIAAAGMAAAHRLGTYRDRMLTILNDLEQLPANPP